MPALRTLSAVFAASLAGGCTATRDNPPQPDASTVAASRDAETKRQQDRQAGAHRLVIQYDACVGASYLQQIRVTTDKSLAVEQAFAACATEENALYVWGTLGGFYGPGSIPYNSTHSALAARKLALKRALIAS